jgi:hypothetical protein
MPPAMLADAVATAVAIDGAARGVPVPTMRPAVSKARIDRQSIFGIPLSRLEDVLPN